MRRIVNDVRRRWRSGTAALCGTWDGLGSKQPLRVSEAELNEAWQATPPELRKALAACGENIRRFCEWQKPTQLDADPREAFLSGNWCGPSTRWAVMCRADGYPLVSTLLMTVIPAQVAGVKNIRVFSPKPSAEVLAAVGMLGVSRVLSRGRSAGDCGVGLRYRKDSASRQDRRTGKCLCDGCQENSLFRLCD